MDLLRSLPIGLYLEQPVTWLHRLDPRVKMAWLMSILVTPILANAYWRFGLVALLVLLTFVMPDGLQVSQTPRLPTPTSMETLENPPEELPELPQPTSYRYVVIDWGPITVTRRSLDLGIRIGTLLFTLIYGTNLYLLTTAPEEITLALETLMAPLRWFRLPVTEIALTVTLSLRFIPLVLEEVQNLVRSVQTRAINWKKLGFRGSAQVWLAVMERLLENLLLRAEQIAAAMEVRGFTSPNEHRVRWYQLVLRSWDWFFLGLLVVFWWARWVWGGEI
jgi:energy-coupling factor transport system permease protein